MKIDQSQLDRAVSELSQLSTDEYTVNLEALLSDTGRTPPERRWRLGRLLGVKVKEPFASCTETSPSAETGAVRRWDLRQETFLEPKKQDTWQFRMLAALIREPELRRQEPLGPEVEWAAAQIANNRRYSNSRNLAKLLASWFRIRPDIAEHHAASLLTGSPPLNSADEVQSRLEHDLRPHLVENAAVEMIHERGFFRSMAISLDNHLRMPSHLRSELQPSSPGLHRSPRSLIGPLGVERANALRTDIEWIGVADPLLAAGFMILLDDSGVDGFCDWVNVDVRPRFGDETVV